MAFSSPAQNQRVLHTHVTQLINALTGVSGAGEQMSFTQYNNSSNYACDVRNLDTTNGYGLRVRDGSSNNLILAYKNNIALGASQANDSLALNIGITTAVLPKTSDGAAIGSATFMWSDLFLASGAVINFNNGDVTITHAANTLTLAGATSGYVFNDGIVYIGDTANANMTAGLTINQAGADNEILAIKSSDVAHGVTTQTETDTWFFLKKISSTGGVTLSAMGSDTDAQALDLNGIAATTSGTRSTAAKAAIQLQAFLRNTTGIQSLGADKNLLAVSDNLTARFFLDSDGDSHQDVGTAWTNFDDHDDVALLNLLSAHVTRFDDPLREGFGQWLQENPKELEAAKLVTFNEDGHHFVNMSRLTMLHTGAIRQFGQRFGNIEQRLALAEQKLAALPAA